MPSVLMLLSEGIPRRRDYFCVSVSWQPANHCPMIYLTPRPCISTGYLNMREANANLFGRHVIDKTDEVWGLDDEGEIKGSYRPSGYPGVSMRDYV